jgi:hypothetical protein
MPAANEAQGLKIAVAAFVTLTVVLAVTTYFAYSSYSQAAARQAAAESKASDENKARVQATQAFNYLRDRAGYTKAGEDQGAVEAAVKKDDQRLNDALTALSTKIKGLAEEYRAAGGNSEKVTQLTRDADQLVAQITSDPIQNRTFASTINSMTQLLDNMAELSTSLTLDNEGLRKSLASVNAVNAEQLQVETNELRKAKDDLAAEHDRHEEERQSLIRKNDELQTRSSQQETEIARLNQVLAQLKDETGKRTNDLLAQIRGLRERVEKQEDVMDVPDGRITFVDYNRKEVQTDITRAQGARERLQLAVFDRDSPGLPSDRPKGFIELIRVTDSGSVGRILKTTRPSEPIKYSDLVYSAAWSPNQPQRFALVGRIDIDRDGRDDREDLKRLIQAAGGVIDYDLPPPGIGKETGELTAQTTWYVTDERPPMRAPVGRTSDTYGTGEDNKAYLDRRSEVLQQAHLNGVRPIAVERLLAQLGYSFGSPIPGRTEALNREASRALTNPRGRANATPTQAEPAPDEGEEPNGDANP